MSDLDLNENYTPTQRLFFKSRLPDHAYSAFRRHHEAIKDIVMEVVASIEGESDEAILACFEDNATDFVRQIRNRARATLQMKAEGHEIRWPPGHGKLILAAKPPNLPQGNDDVMTVDEWRLHYAVALTRTNSTAELERNQAAAIRKFVLEKFGVNIDAPQSDGKAVTA